MARTNDMRKARQRPSALAASAQRFGSIQSSVKPSSSGDSAWQKAAWDFYDLVGEFEFVANWIGNNISQARLYAARDGKEINTGDAHEAVQELFGSTVGKERALRTLGVQSTVAGESYIFSYEEGGERHWDVIAGQSVSKPGSDTWRIDGKPVEGTDLLVVRTWERHPQKFDAVSAPSRAALPILNEIHLMDQHVEAQANSRLASAGIMFVPNEMAFASATDTDADEVTNDSKADEFVRELVETAQTAIVDRANPSALVPIIVTADADTLDKVQLINFHTELDGQALEIRNNAIRRLALALDVPPEILSGTGDVSHWQAWGVDEAAIKAHLEPLLMRIVGDLTEGFLWPALEGVVPPEDLHRYTIMADTTSMRVRPNRSQEAITLWEHGELSAAAMRRENGFTEEDAPDPKEREEFMYRKIGVMAADVDMSSQALQHLGLDIEPPEEPTEGNQEQAPPGLGDTEDRSPVPSDAEIQDLIDDAERKAQEAALIAAAEQMVFRALERAGNKAKSQLHFKPTPGLEPAEFYLFRKNSDAEASFMLQGAFGQCERFAHRFNMRPALMEWTLETYCRDLIVNNRPHSLEALARMLVNQEVSNV